MYDLVDREFVDKIVIFSVFPAYQMELKAQVTEVAFVCLCACACVLVCVLVC